MKKLMLFASLAMAAAAFAVPSSASAVWTNNHADIAAGTNPQIHLEGTWEFTSPVGGTHCSQVTATIQLTGGTTTWHITQFTPTLSSCKGQGALAGCTLNSITTEGFPWTGHTSGNIVTQTGVLIQYHVSGLFCPKTLQIETTATEHVTLQGLEAGGVVGHTTITALKIGGGLTITNEGSDLGTASPAGTLTLTAPDSGRYGWT